MMLDPFHISINVLFIDPDHFQEFLQQMMSVYKTFTYLLAFARKHKPPIFLINDIFILVQLLDHLSDGRGMNFQSFGNIGNTRISLLINQFINALQIILHTRCWHLTNLFSMS
ncbi:hypothetical protein D3C77_668830 [compost metagenome]